MTSVRLDRKTEQRLQARARIMKALAHPSRLFIVERLREREHCVCELTAMIGADISTVSKHLAVLKSAGIVEDERRGVQIFYSLKCPCVVDFFSCAEAILRAEARQRLEIAR